MTLTAAMRRAMLWMALVVASTTIVIALIANALAGADGLWSALAGGALAMFFTIATVLAVLAAQSVKLEHFMAVILGLWILKTAVFVGIALWIRGQSFVVPVAFAAAVLVGAIASLVVDVLVLLRSRIPIVDEGSGKRASRRSSSGS